MITTLLIIHALTSVALLGAITHQALSVWRPTRVAPTSFFARFRSVSAANYVNAIILLFVVVTFIGGVLIYPAYRISVRIVLTQLRLNVPNGLFELKEHFAAVGLGLLPAYWYYWRQPLAQEYARTRAVLTTMLAFIVWWGFIVGHILNNIRGFGS
jgi:hypothetical protein